MNLNTTLRKSYDSQSLIMRTLFALDPDTNMPINANYIVSTDGLGGVSWMDPFTNLSTAGPGVGYLPSTLASIQSSINTLSAGTAVGNSLLDVELASTLQYSPYFSSIKIGYFAASTQQASGAISIGAYAGYSNQGANSIAIGYGAGYSSQAPSSIVLSALVSTLNVRNSGFYVAPLRSTQTTYTHDMGYNSNTAEIGMVPKNFMNLVVSTLGPGDVQMFLEDNGKFFYYLDSCNNTVKMPTTVSNGWNAYISLNSNSYTVLSLDTTTPGLLVSSGKGYLACDGTSFYFI